MRALNDAAESRAILDEATKVRTQCIKSTLMPCSRLVRYDVSLDKGLGKMSESEKHGTKSFTSVLY